MKAKKICIVDYGVSNVFSLVSAIKSLGYSLIIDSDGKSIAKSDLIFIPGVCSFGTGIDAINKTGQARAVSREANNGKPIVGLCLGAHMLFASSEESINFKGLNLVPGNVVKIPASKGFKVPNQNWHRIRFDSKTDTRAMLPESYYYFSHSYEMILDSNFDHVYRIGNGNSSIVAAFKYLNYTGIQFHPELSGESGLRLLSLLMK